MSGRPLHVLHVVRAMNRGGVETWLMHQLRHFDRRVLKLDFLVHTAAPAAYDEEILGRGASLIRCPRSPRSPSYAAWISAFLRRSDRYDAVHSHVHHFSGYLLALARYAAVPVRIAHSHNDTLAVDRISAWTRRSYLALMRRCLWAQATHMVATSAAAGLALFGPGWEHNPKSHVLCCGIDLAPIRSRPSRAEARAALGIASDELVIGHVGRFEEQKNHRFLVRVAAEVSRLQPRMRLLLVGDGPLRREIEESAKAQGLLSRTIFTGQRGDVSSLLSSMDVFAFPSLYEGLGLAVVEAQACGLPCVISNSVPDEAVAVPGLIHRAPNSADPASWARLIAAVSHQSSPGFEESFSAVENSRLNIANSMKALYALYQTPVRTARSFEATMICREGTR